MNIDTEGELFEMQCRGDAFNRFLAWVLLLGVIGYAIWGAGVAFG